MSSDQRPITIAILAMGGEGGGVLADWLVAMSERAGWMAQTTSVPGVAQRTGATVYYLELFPGEGPAARGRQPVLALMPTAGEVDLAVASELMEAGRAVQRGFVTPDRTTLVSSTHRVYSMTERTAMGDGRVDSRRLIDACRAASRRCVMADFAALAREQGSVISAVLFGAIAATGRLPFARDDFEAAIRAGGVGVTGSLMAFAAGYERGQRTLADPGQEPPAADGAEVDTSPAEVPSWGPALDELVAQARQCLPPELLPGAVQALRRLADYQDVAYARLYLERLRPFASRAADPALATRSPWLDDLLRHLALWMSYEDAIRVADLKTRPQRLRRVADEVGLRSDELLTIDEFLHPRIEELADVMPASIGNRLVRSAAARSLVGRWVGAGRIVRTTSLRGYLSLWLVAGLRRWRLASSRYRRENAAIERWLATIAELLPSDPPLAHEVIRLQRLVKGYGDTLQRGSGRFERLMTLLPALRSRAGAAAALRDLADAALADEDGRLLAERLAQVNR